MKALDKPEKIYIANTNLMYTTVPDIGNLRETFFLNQVQNYYAQESKSEDSGIYASQDGDFYVDQKYTFEIGGKNKSFKQIKDKEDSFVVSDDLELGFKHKIPLWLFGFLY
jgi:hydrogenase maturation factor HypE